MSFQKFSAEATTKTHGAVDATVLDVLNPLTPLVGSTENLLRSAAWAAGGYLFRGYRMTGSWSF